MYIYIFNIPSRNLSTGAQKNHGKVQLGQSIARQCIIDTTHQIKRRLLTFTKFCVISTGDVAIFGKIRSECRNETGKPIRDG